MTHQTEFVFAQQPGCATCGALTKRFISSGRFAKYCSEACQSPRKTTTRHGVYQPRDRGGLVKYGDGPCSRMLYGGYCKGCGRDSVGTAMQMTRARYCSARCRERAAKAAFVKRHGGKTSVRSLTCPQCQRIFPSVERGEGKRLVRRTFCSVECRNAAQGDYLAKVRPPTKVRTCSKCGIMPLRSHQQLCDSCKVLRAAENATRAAENREKARLIERERRLQARARHCLWCGVGFSPIIFNERGYNSRYCSLDCQTLADRHARRDQKNRERHSSRARRKGGKVERVDPLIVFALHRWTCQICRVATPESLRGTNHPCEPTLDHVIPLAKGGDHTYANAQCACRDCNTRKNDGVEIFHEVGLVKDAKQGGDNGTS